MKLFLILFSTGILVASYFANLPTLFPLQIGCLLIFSFACFSRRYRHYFLLLFSALFGFTFGVYSGYKILDNQLPLDLQEQELKVRGYVLGVPQQDERHQTFQFEVETAELFNQFESSYSPARLKFPKRISVTLYDSKTLDEEQIKPGSHWQFRVKVKRPRSLVNPQGYDFEINLLRRAIGASSYVRPSTENMQLAHPKDPLFCVTHFFVCVDEQRFILRDWILQHKNLAQAPLLNALLIGDTSLLEKDQWKLYVQTGTLHLIAISGLHLGFFAIVGFFLGNILGRCLHLIWFRCDAFLLGHISALCCVIAYSVLAGLNIPTQRTLVMLLVVQIAWLVKRNPPSTQCLLLALTLVLIVDPYAGFDKGFWLSFGAVGLLVFYFSGRIQINTQKNISQKIKTGINEFLKSQWLMLLGLLVPLSLLTSQLSLSAPLANLVAIPLVTFFVVPCLIISTLTHFISEDLAGLFLTLADSGAQAFHLWLIWVLGVSESLSRPGWSNYLVQACLQHLPLVIACIFIILLPKGIRNIWLGSCGLILCFCLPQKALPELQILVFDVGQGTSVFVRTPHHQLLYDTGPKFTENFDAGSGIIQPYLQLQGISYLDALIVSHNDQDHSGGLLGVLMSTQIGELYLGQPELVDNLKIEPYSRSIKAQNTCHQKKSWRWDKVNFEFIDYAVSSRKSNNHSCVLLVNYLNQKILLTGDIEKEVEQELLQDSRIASVNILLAPHHGSHTSSSESFVVLTQPKEVIYSAGYHNQHGHPHADVAKRYDQMGAIALNTAYTGAIEYIWQNGNQPQIKAYRKSQRHFWFWDDPWSPSKGPDASTIFDRFSE